MNDQQRYEQEIAEKLQQLPLPDMEGSWKQMKALLDEEMPRRGGWFRRNRRWGLGLLALLIFFSVWFVADSTTSPQAITQKTPASSRNTSQRTEDEKEDPPLVPETDHNRPDSIASFSQPAKDERYSTNKASPKADHRIVSGIPTADRKTNGDKNDKILHKETGPDKETVSTKNKDKEAAGIIAAAKQANITDDGNAGSVAKSPADKNAEEKNSIKDAQKTAANSHTFGTRSRGVRGNGDNTNLHKSGAAKRGIPDNSVPANEMAGPVMIKGSSQKPVFPPTSLRDLSYTSIKFGPDQGLQYNTSALAPDSIQKNFAGAVKQGKTVKMRNGKPVKYKKPYTTEGRNLALGFSLPLGFPLGDQKPLAYNFNAGNNTVSDFLPSPHLQYHLNDKAYLQSEIQFMTPQFIRPILLSYSKREYAATNITVYNSVYARKLYYFNLPVSVHYSPFKHFYLGTGLQFSSLISGVAFFEEQRTGMVPSAELYKSSYGKFRNDTISNKLNGSEFRLMMGANYYWNRFTVGLRYNQALSNYVDLRPTALAPAVTDKNKLLQFYLRYNLWETKKPMRSRLVRK
jgi:hypothetical protein